jgi:hypothetical protein
MVTKAGDGTLAGAVGWQRVMLVSVPYVAPGASRAGKRPATPRFSESFCTEAVKLASRDPVRRHLPTDGTTMGRAAAVTGHGCV